MDLIYYTDCDDFKIYHYNKEELKLLNSTFTPLKKKKISLRSWQAYY